MDELFSRYFSEEMTNEEKEIFLAQVSADKELEKEFIRLKNLSALTVFSFGQPQDHYYAEENLKKLNKSINRQRNKRLLTSLYRYAAVIVVVIVSTWFFSNKYNISKGNTEFCEIEVPIGQTVRLQLSDGSSVWLNSQTKIKFPKSFGNESRCVYLDGEAYFDVTHDENKPFVVHTSRGNIKVLGTTFNVFNYSGNSIFETTLLEGSVLVERETSNEKVLLKPNEQAVLKDGKLIKTDVESERVLSWREGIVDFDNQRLGDIIKRLESYYGMDFIIKEPARLEERFSAKFLLGDKIQEILASMERTGRVSFITSVDGKIVYVK